MYKVIRVVSNSVKNWIFTPRIIISFLLGCALYAMPLKRYLDLTRALGEPGNVIEPFIIAGSTPYLYTFSLLGLLLLLSDAPFITDRTSYVIIRISKRKWLLSQLIYIIFASFFYFFFLSIFTLLFGAATSGFRNEWSNPLMLLAKESPQYLVSKFQISFSFPGIVNILKPWSAWLATWTLNSLYGTLLGLCLFVFNIWGKGIWGWACAMLIHIFSYIVIMNGPMLFPPQLSFLVYAMPAFGYIGTSFPYIGESYFFMCILMFLLCIIAFWGIRKEDIQGAKQ